MPSTKSRFARCRVAGQRLRQAASSASAVSWTPTSGTLWFLGFEELVPAIRLPDPDDRHVVAAAIRGEADTILAANLKDFPASALAPLGLAAEHPDGFPARLCRESPSRRVVSSKHWNASGPACAIPRFSRESHLGALRRAGLKATPAEILSRTATRSTRPPSH